MPGACSADLPGRVVGSVTAGTSRRVASAAFKVSASSALRWTQRFRETGAWQAKPMGGDRRSRAIEAHKDWLLALVAREPDLALGEIRGRLAADKGFAASVSALWRFSERHGISFKKRRTPPSRAGKTSRRRGRSGEGSSPRLTLRDWFSSTKPPPAQTWRGGAGGRRKASA